jgi:hypothetical protein
MYFSIVSFAAAIRSQDATVVIVQPPVAGE